MNYAEAVAYLDGHISRGVKPGLERISALLELMAHPEGGYPIIHIAGSNGKTSTSRLAASILAAHGLKVGTFTSPHLERIEERLALNGAYADPDEFAGAVADVRPFAELFETRTGDPPTYFELTAAMAFQWFAEKAVDVAVVEVGLGGRLDATNAAHGDVAVVTSISLEHTDYLGNTLAEIAREKLGITKPSSVLVLGDLPAEAMAEASKTQEALGVRTVALDRDFSVAEATMAVGGWNVDFEGVFRSYEGIYLPVHGRHQLSNLALAIAAVEELLGRALDNAAVARGVAATKLPGRMEIVGRRPIIMLDGAHNPGGFEALATALDEEFPALEWTVVLGAMRDKDLPGMLEQLRGRTRRLVACSAEASRALPAADLAERASGMLGAQVEVSAEAKVADAVDAALALTEPEGGVMVTGSLYVVGEARTHLLSG